MTAVPELAIDMDDGKKLTDAAQNVLRHYSVETTQKTLDWVSFAGAVGMVYGTRFGAYMLRRRTEAQAQRPGATVYQMPQRPATPQKEQDAYNMALQPRPEPGEHIVPQMDFEDNL